MPRFSDRAGFPDDSTITPPAMLPSACQKDVGTPNQSFRGSIAQPARPLSDASPPPSRAADARLGAIVCR
jgi:hypothetical protein